MLIRCLQDKDKTPDYVGQAEYLVGLY